jgi:tRNA U34 5-carboxymethylaminomethyl modifying enzyme MnmG/GidA
MGIVRVRENVQKGAPQSAYLYWFICPCRFKLSEDGKTRSAADILAVPGVTVPLVLDAMQALGTSLTIEPRVIDNIEITIKYKGYLERQVRVTNRCALHQLKHSQYILAWMQAREIEEFRQGDALPIPKDLNYVDMPALSKEEQELLARHRPVNVHAASRIAGVRPSTLMLLFQIAKKASQNRPAHDADDSDSDWFALADQQAKLLMHQHATPPPA